LERFLNVLRGVGEKEGIQRQTREKEGI